MLTVALAALEYIKQGIRIVPVAPGGKRALRSIHQAITTEIEAKQYWEVNPTHNIGVVTGGNAGIVLDVDFRHNGHTHLSAIMRDEEPTTRIVRTPGGVHIYFRSFANVTNSTRKLREAGLQGLDIRGENSGYVVAPPSTREGGGEYSVLSDAPLAPIPSWLFPFLTFRDVSPGMDIAIKEMRKRVMVVTPGQGNRHNTFVAVAGQFGRYIASNAISEDTAWAIYLYLCSQRNTDGKYAESELRRYFDSGIEYGRDKPVVVRNTSESIVWQEDQLAVICDHSAEVLGKAHVLFEHMFQAVEIVRDRDGPRIMPVRVHALRALLSEYIYWVKNTAKGTRPIAAPLDVARTVLERHNKLPPLYGFITVPYAEEMIRGYDENTGYYVDVPEDLQLTDMTLNGAVAVFRQLLHDFPFVSHKDFAVYLALIFTACYRQFIDGPVPLFLIDAPVRGSGKTILADIVHIIATGHSGAMSTQAPNDEEESKRVLALLRQGETIYIIDNLEEPLGGSVLSSLITSNVFQGRLLGASEIIRTRVRMTIIATGNNIIVKGDLHRRVAPIRIDPKTPFPETRTGFTIPNILHHVHKYRARYLSAIYTIFRFAAKARSEAKEAIVDYSSFQQLMSWLDGVLPQTGLPGLTKIMQDYSQTEDDTVSDLRGFLNAWYMMWREKPMTMSRVLQAMQSPETADKVHMAKQLSHRGAALVSREPSRLTTQQLAARLRKHRDRIAGDKKLVLNKRGVDGYTWSVVRVAVKAAKES